MRNIDELINKLAKDGTAIKPAHHPVLLSLEWIAAAVFYLAVALMISGLRTDLMVKLHQPWFTVEIAALVGIMQLASTLGAVFELTPD